MTHRPQLRLIRRLVFGFGAGIAGGWFAGILTKPSQPSPVRAAGPRDPAAQA